MAQSSSSGNNETIGIEGKFTLNVGFAERATRMRRIAVLVCAAVVCLASCSRGNKVAVTVGCRAGTEQTILAEIVAQHLEKRLGAEVTRNFDLGSTELLFQTMQTNSVDIAPEDTAALVAGALNEAIDPDPAVVMERARNELARLGRVRLMPPLGIERRFVMMVSASVANERKVKTISEAARLNPGWMLGQTAEFQSRSDGYGALMRTYVPRMEVPPVTIPAAKLYSELAADHVDMVSGATTDGAAESKDFVALQDDKNAFRPGQGLLLVREEVLARYGTLEPALAELSGKFTSETIGSLSHDVLFNSRKVPDVAADWLQRSIR